MTGSESLPSRLRTDLQANLPVAVTAAVWGMVGLFGLALSPLADSGGGLLLAMSIAHVAHLYEGYWPVTYETATELLWATAGSGVVGTVFVGVFWGIRAGFGPTVGAAVAFVSAIGLQYGAAWLARRP